MAFKLMNYIVYFGLTWIIVMSPRSSLATRRTGPDQEAQMLERKKYAGYVNALCPPIRRGTHDFAVMSPLPPPMGGCIATEPQAEAPVTLGFEIWMGIQGSCDSIGQTSMSYAQYDCASKWTVPSPDGSRNYTYTMLKNMAAAQSLEDNGLRCSAYDSTERKSKYDTGAYSFRLAISASKDCDGLIQALLNSQQALRRWQDDKFQVYLLPKETETLFREPRHTRDAPLDAGCRFADRMRGEWTTATVEEGVLRYERVAGAESAEVSTDYKVRSSRSVGRRPSKPAFKPAFKSAAKHAEKFVAKKSAKKFAMDVQPARSSRSRRSPGANGNLLGKAFGRIFFPELYNSTRTRPKRDVLGYLAHQFQTVCVAGVLCVDTNIPYSTTTTTTQRTTTIPYWRERDYAMDPAERYNRFNDPFNTKKEFENRRRRRAAVKDQPDMQRFQWTCAAALKEDQYLVIGGPNNENVTDGGSSYACLRVVHRGINVMEFAITDGRKFTESKGSLNHIASKVCGHSGEENQPRKWMTVTKKREAQRQPITCPVLPGMVFVGKVPSPPIESVDVSNAPSQLCAKLVSTADSCTDDGKPGSDDKMKFTISECIDRGVPGVGPELLHHEPNEDNEYQCLAMWSEVQPNMTDIDGKPITFTYVYTKRLNPRKNGTEEFDCFVGTTILNDPGASENTTTMMMTTAGAGSECDRLANPFVSGMKLVGTVSKDSAGNRRHQNTGGNRSASSGATNMSMPVILFSAIILGAAALI